MKINIKPEPITVDNEIFEVIDERDKDPYSLYVSGPHMALSPLEAEELRDFLNKYLEYYYNERSMVI